MTKIQIKCGIATLGVMLCISMFVSLTLRHQLDNLPPCAECERHIDEKSAQMKSYMEWRADDIREQREQMAAIEEQSALIVEQIKLIDFQKSVIISTMNKRER